MENRGRALSPDRTAGERYRRRRKSTPRPAEEQIPIPVPSLLDELTWQAAQRQLDLNSRNAGRNNKVNRYLLRGLIKCPRCGGTYTGAARRGRRLYRCVNHDPVVTSRRCTPGSIPSDVLEDAVWSVIEDAVSRPDMLESQYRRVFMAEDETETDGDLDGSIKKQLRALKRREDRLVEAYSAEAVSLDQLKEAMGKIRAERAELERQLAAAERRRDERESLESSVGRIEEFCRTVGAGLRKLDFDGKRKLLELLVDGIELTGGGRVLVHTVMPPMPPAGGAGESAEVEQLRLYHPELVAGCANVIAAPVRRRLHRLNGS